MKPLHVKVEYRRDVEGQELGNEETPDDSEAERLARISALAVFQRYRQRTQECRHRCHHDRAKAQDATLVNSVLRALSLETLRIEGKVDHHDGVLLYDPEQHDQPDKCVQVQLFMK